MEAIALTADQKTRWSALSPWRTRWPFAPSGDWEDDGARVAQFLAWFGPSPGRVLELSCLEGAHTYPLASKCESVLALEGRAGNVERTQLVGSILGARNVDVLLCDLETATLADYGGFDAVFCVGLLYHLQNPWRLLSHIACVSNRLFLWTHYSRGTHGGWFDEDGSTTAGLSPRSYWPSRGTLLGWLRGLGYSVDVVNEDTSHPYGPCITLACEAS